MKNNIAKTIFIIITVIFPLMACGNQNQNNDDQQPTVTRTPEYLVSHMIRYTDNSRYMEWFYEYENGLLTKATWTADDSSNPVKGTIVYTYDKEGRLIKKVDTQYSNIGSVTGPLFDGEGRITEIIPNTYNGQNLAVEVETTEYEYPEESTSVLAYSVSADGTRTLDYEEYHDAWGHVIGNSKHGYSQLAYDRFGTEIGSILMGTVIDSGYLRSVPNVNTFYDQDNNIRRFAGYSDSEGFTMHKFLYDDQGRISRDVVWYTINLELDELSIYDHQWTYNADGSYVRTIHVYDVGPSGILHGNETLTTTDFAPDHIPAKETLVDMKSGEMIQEIIYDIDGDPENWVFFTNGEPSSFIRYEKDRDEHGNVLETRKYSGELMTECIVYEYVFQ